MSETDLPVEGTGDGGALTLDQGATALEGVLFGNSEANLPEEDESQEVQEQADTDEVDAEDEPEIELEADEAEEDDAPEERQEYKAGKFAADDAKVTLDDGTTISVAELKRNNLYQRDYTRKTQELAHEKGELDKSRQEIAEYANMLARQREAIEALSAELLPPEPDSAMLDSDPLGYFHAKAAYDKRMAEIAAIQQAKQADMHRLAQEQQAARQQAIAREMELLKTELPHLAAEKGRERFINDALTYGGEAYGLTKEEIGSIESVKALKVLQDAIAYRKALARANEKKAANEPAQGKPRLQQKQRMNVKSTAQQAHEQAMARLRKTGSINDAAAALEKFFS